MTRPTLFRVEGTVTYDFSRVVRARDHDEARAMATRRGTPAMSSTSKTTVSADIVTPHEEPKKAPRVSLDAAARLLGATIAKVAAEDAEEWAEVTEPHLIRHGYHRRYSFTELEERGGPPASTAGRVIRRLPNVVQESAGPTLRVYLVSGKVQIDPVVP